MTFSKKILDRIEDPEFRELARQAQILDDFGLELMSLLSQRRIFVPWEQTLELVDEIKEVRQNSEATVDEAIEEVLAARGYRPRN